MDPTNPDPQHWLRQKSYCRERHRQDRRDHAITIHSFPPDFRFDESKKPQRNGGGSGSDRKQQQRPMKAIKKPETGQEKTVPEPPAAANGGGATDGGGMEVDGEIGVGGSGVAIRRYSGARRPLSLARLELFRSHWPGEECSALIGQVRNVPLSLVKGGIVPLSLARLARSRWPG